MTLPRRVLLVGFMGSGKSSVGPLVARALGWAFHDFDEVLEAEEGRPVARIFAGSGEAWFREAEDRVARRLLALDGVVLASGGGWAAVAGRLRSLPVGTRSVWLKVTPEEAVRRAAGEAGSRPLLLVPDPLAEARRLLAERSPRYGECDLEVDTDGRSMEDVTARILEALAKDPVNHTAVETG